MDSTQLSAIGRVGVVAKMRQQAPPVPLEEQLRRVGAETPVFVQVHAFLVIELHIR
ncbi:MAG: hypothetical protein JWP36_2619 [Paucimonas sp.]|nr:hypothetical protein [Paucimonas sp.]